jgi:hypothetical protein
MREYRFGTQTPAFIGFTNQANRERWRLHGRSRRRSIMKGVLTVPRFGG